METVENTYCRFCAELKGADKVLNLREDSNKWNEIHSRLAFLNALYVNINSDNILPKTICFVCYDSLNKACEFLDKVKRAQDELNNLFSVDENRPCIGQEKGFDDYLSDTAADDPSECHDIKQESPNKAVTTNVSLDIAIDIKREPKDEADTILHVLSKESTTVESNIDVSDLIDAAIHSTNFSLFTKDSNNSNLSLREINSWNDYPWICGFCNLEFINIDVLRSHSKAAHGKCSPFMCIDCRTVKTESFTSFIKHVRKHRKYLRSFCYYCNESIDKGDNLHVKTHYIKPQMPCSLCGEIQKNEEALKIHLQEYSLTKRKRRPRRKPGTPITIQDLTCDLCNKVYKNPNSLRDHRKLHTVDRQRNYTCDRCGKMFYNKGTLTSHIMAHDNVRPHVCRICNKSFLYPNVLRRHVDMHTGVKPYSCDECGRCFRLPYQLKSHMIIHTDNMPYVCQYCNKAFRFKQILKNHERQHTGAKPYACKHCGMEFTNWSNYNKHMKRRHGMDVSKKKITPEGVFPINPQTGQIIQVDDPDPMGTVEWKKRIMLPAKRGKKKVIKQEKSS